MTYARREILPALSGTLSRDEKWAGCHHGQMFDGASTGEPWRRILRRAGQAAPPLLAAMCVAAGPLIVADRWREGHHVDAVITPVLLVLPVVGALVARHRPRNAVGWLFLASGVAVTVGLLLDDGRLPLRDDVAVAAAIGSQVAFSAGLPLLALALVLFPDGRPPSGRWRALALVLAGSIGLGTGSALIARWPEDLYLIQNPLSPAGVGDVAATASRLSMLMGLGAVPLAAVALAFRYRAGSAVERVRLMWVLFPIVVGGIALATVVTVDAFGDVPAAVEGFALAPLVIGVPVGAAIGILRHRLFDIDLIVNRTLVFGGAWLILLGGYVATVLVGSSVFADRVEWAPPLIAAMLVAVAFHPLRLRIQRAVDRRLFGARSDPYRVLATIDDVVSGMSEVEEACNAIVQAVSSALRVPFCALELSDGTRAEVGIAGRTPVVDVVVRHGADALGVLEVGRRSPNEDFARSEHRLLEDLATQAAIAIRATSAVRDLRESRRRIVDAVEEERRRVRRDLHDGLGAALTGLTFSVRAAQDLLDKPARADEILDKVGVELRVAIDDIRRLVHDLRPPALDDLGLASALREQVQQLCSAASVRLTVDAPPRLPPLPPGTETAAYRIAMEACTNVVRHARATQCWLRIQAKEMLHVEVGDDGIGIEPLAQPGTGAITMRERAQELGGDLTIAPRPDGGTIVLARLPLLGT